MANGEDTAAADVGAKALPLPPPETRTSMTSEHAQLLRNLSKKTAAGHLPSDSSSSSSERAPTTSPAQDRAALRRPTHSNTQQQQQHEGRDVQQQQQQQQQRRHRASHAHGHAPPARAEHAALRRQVLGAARVLQLRLVREQALPHGGHGAVLDRLVVQRRQRVLHRGPQDDGRALPAQVLPPPALLEPHPPAQLLQLLPRAGGPAHDLPALVLPQGPPRPARAHQAPRRRQGQGPVVRPPGQHEQQGPRAERGADPHGRRADAHDDAHAPGPRRLLLAHGQARSAGQHVARAQACHDPGLPALGGPRRLVPERRPHEEGHGPRVPAVVGAQHEERAAVRRHAGVELVAAQDDERLVRAVGHRHPGLSDGRLQHHAGPDRRPAVRRRQPQQVRDRLTRLSQVRRPAEPGDVARADQPGRRRVGQLRERGAHGPRQRGAGRVGGAAVAAERRGGHDAVAGPVLLDCMVDACR